MTVLAQSSHNMLSAQADLVAMLNLLSNPELFKQNLAHLEQKEKECDEKIALAGKAQDILYLRDKAQADATDAQNALNRAMADSQQMVADAKSDAISIVSTAKKEAEDIIARANQSKNDIIEQATQMLEKSKMDYQAAMDEVARKEIDLRNYEVKLEDRNNELMRLQADLKVRETEFSNVINDTVRQKTEADSMHHRATNQLEQFVTLAHELEARVKMIVMHG